MFYCFVNRCHSFGHYNSIVGRGGTSVSQPHPATATIQLPTIPGTGTATLILLDALGRTLRTQAVATNSKAELDLTGLPAGWWSNSCTASGATFAP